VVPSPYEDLPKYELILRDVLAVDRTVLANERTFLAYVRTALAFVITGVGLIKFFESFAIEVAGWAFVAFSILILAIGFKRFIRMRHSLANVQDAARAERRTERDQG